MEQKVIISLTSYKDRLPMIWLTLSTLKKQTRKADKIILNVWEGDLQYIPFILKHDIEKGNIELMVYEHDIKGHKKYYKVMQEYPNDIIITVDDDALYPEDLVESLLKTHEQHPNCVCGRFVHRIIKGEKYKDWEHYCMSVYEPSMDLYCSGVGGVLYPPSILHIEDITYDDIFECINADDVMLKHLQYKNGIKVVWTPNDKPNPKKIPFLINNARPTLSDLNTEEKGNDYYLSKFKCYDEE